MYWNIEEVGEEAAVITLAKGDIKILLFGSVLWVYNDQEFLVEPLTELKFAKFKVLFLRSQC